MTLLLPLFFCVTGNGSGILRRPAWRPRRLLVHGLAPMETDVKTISVNPIFVDPCTDGSRRYGTNHGTGAPVS